MIDALSVLAQHATDSEAPVRYTVAKGAFPTLLRNCRSGIYVLEFCNGEHYVGQAVQVCRRLAQHLETDTHSDFSSICFLTVAKDRLAEVERETIAACERAGIRLRNHVYASFNFQPSELDQIVSPEFLDRFVDGCTNDLNGIRPDDADLRRKHATRFQLLQRSSAFDQIVSALRTYVRECMPAPLKTEMGYWSVSCLPARAGSRLFACVSVYWQEVLFLGEDDDGPWARLNVAASPLVEAGQLEAAEITDPGYVAGGADQQGLLFPLSEFKAVLNEPGVRKAARVLTVRLMRKGRCNFSRSHCPQLADQLLSS